MHTSDGTRQTRQFQSYNNYYEILHQCRSLLLKYMVLVKAQHESIQNYYLPKYANWVCVLSTSTVLIADPGNLGVEWCILEL